MQPKKWKKAKIHTINLTKAMKKTVLLAEEGELTLLDKARTELGLDLSDAEIIYTGVGAINVIRSLQHLDRDTLLINIGYAGSANFDIGTWVAVSEVHLNHPNVTYPEPELKLQITNGETSPLFHQYRFCAGVRLSRLRLRHGTGLHCCAWF